jgi:hypothetical protein
MKSIVLIVLIAVVAMVGWRIGNQISSDAVSMAVGVLFGVLAGVPTALMVLASSRRRSDEEGDVYGRNGRGAYGGYFPQPPVIVVTGAPQGQQTQDQRALPPPNAFPGQTIDARQFRVVGEKEEWIDEW